MITKAAVLFKKNDVRIVNVKLPLLKDNQVLVKIKYTSICHTQLQEIFGLRGKDKYLPHCLGHEATGIVENVGMNVKKVKIKDKVCLTWVPSEGKGSKNTQYTLQKSGKIINAGPVNTFSKYSIISENKLIKLKKSTDLKKAVLLGCAVPTAFNCFVNTLKNTNSMRRIIHDPKKNKSFFITGYNDNQISEIQLSLNKRNKKYEIKNNSLYKNNSLIQSLTIF